MKAKPTGKPIGWWRGDPESAATGDPAMTDALQAVHRPMFVIDRGSAPAVTHTGSVVLGPGQDGPGAFPLLGLVPPMVPEALGDPGLKAALGIRYAYIAGAMANGITSVEMVEAVGKAGMIGFFGAAGLPPKTVEDAVRRLQTRLGALPFGSNLIHSPYEADLEWAIADLYHRLEVRRVSASAYLQMTAPLICYRVRGIHRDASGAIVAPNRVVAKISRVEVAEKFMSPPPRKILAGLVAAGKITAAEAELAEAIPVADILTAEADSGGHTDNRPALALLPTILALRDRMAATHAYAQPIHVGLGGGIATPHAVAAAFAMGAAYVLTGTVNQACVESGTCDTVRTMLSQAGQADVIMAPAADMFELGVKVQVLKRGTLFAVRAQKLYELFRHHASYEEIPETDRRVLERDLFRRSFEEEWGHTRRFFLDRDPAQVTRAERDPHHRMALVFRSYLGQSSRWAITGAAERVVDFQIWCGPGIGAFNEWTRGTFLEAAEHRKTVTVAMNLLMGACVITRAGWLRVQGVSPGPAAERFAPLTEEALSRRMGDPIL